MTTCPDCGSSRVVSVQSERGYSTLFNLGAPHRVTCKAGPGRKQPDELLQALYVQGYKPLEAKRLADAARKRKPGADLGTLFVEALSIRGKELGT